MRGSPGRTELAFVGRPLRPEERISSEELARIAGIRLTTLMRLVRLGIVDPIGPGTSDFTVDTAARLRRVLRLHDDLRVDLFGATIIVDLLERLERLETEMLRLRGGDTSA